ncbi:hypothetical protein ACYFX5_03700 [Bremerella sp. T1]|uniref:hypothetical protein n=1 Tax=Bremerella sp. TYQ1 TaxID=3119568 RepID=UPI001CCC1F18|nr:hypothetical protein [Bremerella volcania]UBM37376.1 hypothetical protein LA756_05655 [Bremerella volcania]
MLKASEYVYGYEQQFPEKSPIHVLRMALGSYVEAKRQGVELTYDNLNELAQSSLLRERQRFEQATALLEEIREMNQRLRDGEEVDPLECNELAMRGARMSLASLIQRNEELDDKD